MIQLGGSRDSPASAIKLGTFVRNPFVHLHHSWSEWYPIKNDPVGVLFICHGYGEHIQSGYFETLAVPLNNIGFLVSGYDYAGHGRSQGRRGYFKNIHKPTDDVIMFVQILKKNYPTLPTFILGYSFGGIVAILAAIKRPDLFTGIILESAAIDYNRNTITSNLLYLGAILSCCCPCLILKTFTDDLSKNDPNRIQYLTAGTACFLISSIRNIKNEVPNLTLPVLVVHGLQDEIIPFHSSINFINSTNSKDKSLKLYQRTKHDLRFDNEEDYVEYIHHLKQWLLARI